MRKVRYKKIIEICVNLASPSPSIPSLRLLRPSIGSVSFAFAGISTAAVAAVAAYSSSPPLYLFLCDGAHLTRITSRAPPMRSSIYSLAAIARFFSTSISDSRSSSTSLRRHQSIQTLASVGRLKDAIRLLIFRLHLRRPVQPDCFAAILRPCVAPENLIAARQLHAYMTVTGFNQNPYICNHLINAYGKCGILKDAHWVFRLLGKKNLHSWNTLMACYCKFGYLDEARQLFEEITNRDVASWNTMIAGYDKWGPWEVALEVFVRMRRSECIVDHFGMSSVTSACSGLRSLENGKGLHCFSLKIGLDSHVQIGSAMVELYAKCQELDDAILFFDEMGHKELFTWNSMLAGHVECSRIDKAIIFFENMPEKNVVSWTTVIDGCCQHGRNEEAIGFFQKMQEIGVRPDWLSFLCALDACVKLLNLEEGSKIHAQVIKGGYRADLVVGSTLVSLYAKCGNLTDARNLTCEMATFDDFSWSVLISEYAKQGFIDIASSLFESFQVKTVPLWNALVGGYSTLGLVDEAFEAFRQMRMDGKHGDDFTFGSLLYAASYQGKRYVEQLHSYIIKVGYHDSNFVSSALIYMYSSILDSEAAVRIFNLTVEPNLIVWSSIIYGLLLNNLAKEACYTFSLMIALGKQPDITSLSLILNACSSLSILHDGTQIHALAYKIGFGSNVVVGSALIDMYAKCGKIDSASCAFHDIESHNVVSWTALLSGYIHCGRFDEAKMLFDMMPAPNIVSWNTMLLGYAKKGLALEALQLYYQMCESGMIPNEITFTTLLSICRNISLEQYGKKIHVQIVKNGYHKNARINSNLTYVYQKHEQLANKNDLHSGSVDSKVDEDAYGLEPDTVSDNIKLLASVYFKNFERTDFPNRTQ